jgi:hypothetical protein
MSSKLQALKDRLSRDRLRRGKMPVPSPRIPCIHLGEPTGETALCRSCRGGRGTRLKIRACAVHERCTPDPIRPVEGLACCGGCPDFKPGIPYGRPVVRNLLYHVGPFRGNGIWQRNIEQLQKRMHLFNGRRVVAIVTGPRFDPPEKVQAAFGSDIHDYVILPNSEELREVATFLPLMERIHSTARHETTFYAHTKGVTRPVNDGVSIHRWAEIMYETCLDYWPLVERALLSAPLAGSFKKTGWMFSGSRSAWHYSGTFYWLRSCMVFDRPHWRHLDQQWWGTESWPGLLCRADEAACLFHGKAPQSFDLYDLKYLREHVEPAYAQWKIEHAADRRVRT